MTTTAQAPEGWSIDAGGKRMSIAVQTADFVDAIALFGQIADAAEELEHHPDLHLESYNKVRIVTWSHDVGGLTNRDERLAARISGILRERGLAPRRG